MTLRNVPELPSSAQLVTRMVEAVSDGDAGAARSCGMTNRDRNGATACELFLTNPSPTFACAASLLKTSARQAATGLSRSVFARALLFLLCTPKLTERIRRRNFDRRVIHSSRGKQTALPE
jgi:hypothetical protein